MRELYLLNDSARFDDAYVQRQLRAIKLSLDIDYAPEIGTSAVLHFIGRGGALPPDAWGGVLSDVPQSQYLGEHHLENVPRFFVSAATCIVEGASISSVIDHEIKELLLDPPASLCEELEDGTLLAYEASDPCEGAAGAYTVDGVELEDFVYPLAYFKGIGTRYCKSGVLKRPRGEELPPSGYQLIKPPGGQWTMLLGDRVRASKIVPARWSRSGRRMVRGTLRISPGLSGVQS